MELLPGTLASQQPLSADLAREIGIHLAKIHENQAAGYGDLAGSAPLSSDPWAYFNAKFEESYEECVGHLSAEELDACRGLYEAGVSRMNTVDGPRIIHRDFRPGNLIIHQGKLRGIIDWSSARAGFAEEDFYPLDQWAPQQEPFLEGYASIRPLPNYEPIMPLLQLSRTLAAVGFTIRNGTWNTTHADFYRRHCDILNHLGC